MARWPAACGAILFLLGWSGRALAEPPPNDAEVGARLAFIERALTADQAGTRLWQDAWTGFFGAATLAQAGMAASVETRSARVAGIAGAVKAGIGFGFMIVSPASGRTAADTLRALPSATPSERLAKLRRAEALLHTVAEEERFRRGWFPSIGGALVNLGGAWAVWALTHDAVAGWIGLTSGLAVSTLHRLTQPSAASRAYNAYTRGDFNPARAATAPSVSIMPSPTGILVHGSF